MRMEIYFMDEAPRLGCGWRTCDVKEGRKWVHIQCKGRRVKLSKLKWNILKVKAKHV